MTYILCIETASKVCSVALHNQGKLCTSNEISVDRSHSGSLVPMISEILTKTGIHADELDAIAISKGPGSYTGLRIGVSTAKGLCFANGIPLLGIDTLRAMSAGIEAGTDLLCPMIDARRMEVYCSIIDTDLKTLVPTYAKIIVKDSFSDLLKDKSITFFGDGANKCKEFLNHKNAHFVDDYNPSAKFMGVLAYNKFQKEEFEDVGYFEPFYLKEFYGVKLKSTN